MSDPTNSKARLEIRVWTEGDNQLPDHLQSALQPHVEHVANMLAQGYIAGQVVDDHFSGWWEIIKD